uniref:Uncharacterized protein n=1 Tax=Candidatus Kentrum sp. TC TaxID=2126339 RepID=A0A450Z5B7_9GAMM|nr:MAG: hypothetical protein BECKTC1821D_GA0114238_106516 [Candidatus Kentron sp. TC]
MVGQTDSYAVAYAQYCRNGIKAGDLICRKILTLDGQTPTSRNLGFCVSRGYRWLSLKQTVRPNRYRK